LVGTITYDAANNVITAVGGTSSASVGFVDLYNADVAGSRSLKAATASPFTASLDTPVKPAGSLALKINCVVTNFSVAGTVQLTGRDAWGNAQSETVNITGNGTFTTTKYFASIDTNGVVAAGTYTVAITQPRWGVVWQTGTNQYLFNSKVSLGDGSTTTYFGDTAKQIIFSASVAPVPLTIRGKATATFGTLIDASAKTTKNGCDFIYLSTGSQTAILDTHDWESPPYTCNLYSCSFLSKRTANIKVYGNVYNCLFRGEVPIYLEATSNYYNCIVESISLGINNFCFLFDASPSSLNSVQGFNAIYAVWLQGNMNPTVSNLYARNCTYIAGLYQYTGSTYLINADADTWAFQWGAGGNTGAVYRQYTFDLTVTDAAGNAIPNAAVTVKDKNGKTVFSLTTDANGKTATQTVTRGYYDQAHGNTLQDSSPHTLIITKAGWQKYLKTFTLTEKTKWEIKLAKAQAVLNGLGQPIVNLNATDPENVVVLPL
jgi:hypothetical protein